MAKKKTKTELFNEMLSCEAIAENAEWKALIENEIALIAKANSNRKPTATQLENEKLATYVTSEFERLRADGFISQKEFHSKTTCDSIKELTPQRLTPILNKLVAQNVLLKVQNAKKDFVYSIA